MSEAAHEPEQPKRSLVSAWVLAGGEGRRMGGADKGLQPWQGQPLAHWVMNALRHQVQCMGVCANRNLPSYERLLSERCLPPLSETGNLGAHPDDPDLPARSGPLAGITAGLTCAVAVRGVSAAPARIVAA